MSEFLSLAKVSLLSRYETRSLELWEAFLDEFYYPIISFISCLSSTGLVLGGIVISWDLQMFASNF